ncbi:hypothetical protein MRB53_040824 [Persea americana]|nr:hypothetical protein MRB53_040824 [Persea americana]
MAQSTDESSIVRDVTDALHESIKGFKSPTASTANSPVLSSTEPQAIADLTELSEVLSKDVEITEESVATAEKLKADGNAKLLAKDFVGAIKLYTEAIDMNPTKAVYWANRAQAEISSEQFGSAIADATMAIKLDPSYVKAYYRRAVSYVSITKHKDAFKDFKKICQLVPNDKQAKNRMSECNKLIRRLAFEEAIEVDDPPSAAEGLDIASMTVPDTYDGVRLETQMTQEFIDDMLQRFKTGKTIHVKYVYQILLAIKDILTTEATMTDIGIMENSTLTVCGDTHGQFFDLMHIFEVNGYPSASNAYLFNGDFVDRGSWSTEIALTLYAYKWLMPQHLHLNRGNHETDDMNKVYGFEGECKAKYTERVFKIFSESFSLLPLAALVQDQYLVLHGGLFSDDKIKLDDLRNINRHKKKQPGHEGLMMEMLWTDPQTAPGRGPSKRGVGLQFGPDVTKRFCDNNGLKAIIRSHEVRQDGYEIEHNGRCITVFSAPNYCDTQGNDGAYIIINSKGDMDYRRFKASKHPEVRPMAYSSMSSMI